MDKRKIGKAGLEAYPFALGSNVFGWTVEEAMAFKILDAFVERGFALIDTADAYSAWVPGNHGGESETIIGKWLKQSGRRKDIILATKVGKLPGRKGLSKQNILKSAEESLKRLQTDHIDLYQAHAEDPETPIEETLEAFDQLIRQGKARAIGASNYGAENLLEALDVSKQLGYARYECLQPFYNLYDRAEFEQDFETLCMEQELGVISYFSLAMGFLTGKYRSEKDLSKSQRGARVKHYLDDRGFRILDALDQVAQRTNTTLAQVAIAWLIARPSITAPIASATNLEQLNDLMQAAELKLDEASIEMLNTVSAERATADS